MNLQHFFEEKAIPTEVFTVHAEDGTLHILDTDVVIAAILQAPACEQEAIGRQLSRLDIANAPITGYLKHLGQALARPTH